MPYLHNYKLFISHAWSYSESYERTEKFLKEAPNFSWTNFSVPKIDPLQAQGGVSLEEQLRRQIRPVQCVIIIAGMYVAHSSWIQFEIDFARELQKPILGIIPWGAERTPVAVSLAANLMVKWNSASIVHGIRSITP
jgi:hypothetical protein